MRRPGGTYVSVKNILTNWMEQGLSLEPDCSHAVQDIPHFKKKQVSLLCSIDPAHGPYPEPVEFSVRY
jgi:hypothetical protein